MYDYSTKPNPRTETKTQITDTARNLPSKRRAAVTRQQQQQQHHGMRDRTVVVLKLLMWLHLRIVGFLHSYDPQDLEDLWSKEGSKQF